MATQASPFLAPDKTLGIDLTAVDTSAKHEVGTAAFDQSGNKFVYVSASTEALTLDAFVTISSTGVATLADASGNRLDGIAHVAIALNSYGWVGVQGDFADAAVAGGLTDGALFQHFVNASAQAQALHATGSSAGDSAARGIVISTPASNVATVRLF